MTYKDLQRYVLSCGLLFVPVMLWDAAFTELLPQPLSSEEFWRDIPPLVAYGENALRVIVIALPFLMPLDLSTAVQRRRLALFAIGLGVYFLAWLPLIAVPLSGWSTSWPGVLAPGFTPMLWLTAIGLLGQRLYWRIPYRSWFYVALAGAFVALHVTHTYIVYARNY